MQAGPPHQFKSGHAMTFKKVLVPNEWWISKDYVKFCPAQAICAPAKKVTDTKITASHPDCSHSPHGLFELDLLNLEPADLPVNLIRLGFQVDQFVDCCFNERTVS
ncbi:MAG TPA: hypothetical protein VJY15_12385 [Candidatus Acidoferrum sp.]|nr:hypothetical protein [Candidatus Acidoferrum sp.]